MALTQLVVPSSPTPVLQKIRSSSVGLFSDYTGLIQCSGLIFPFLSKEKGFGQEIKTFS